MTRTSGARVLAEMLDAYGVTHVFMVPAVLRRSMAEMERRTGIEVIHTHGEKPAAYMADGYARVSGRPGVCMAQQVGALNLAAGLRDAYLASSPVIAMTGGSPAQLRHRNLYQAADDLPAFAPYTKLNAALGAVERFPDLIARAFGEATSGCPGPCTCSLQARRARSTARSPTCSRAATRGTAGCPPTGPRHRPVTCRRLLERLQAAARPVIVAGGGVHHSGAAADLVRLAEALQVPVATSLNGRGAIPERHPLALGVMGTYSRPSANRSVHEADFALFVGSGAGA